MSGISNYYHGERGVARSLKWVASDDTLIYRLELKDDPHRAFTQDYASDIGIDPAIRPGDAVVYVRMDYYSGVWVKKGHEYSPLLDQALHRERAIRDRCHRFLDLCGTSRILARIWARLVAARTRLPFDIASKDYTGRSNEVPGSYLLAQFDPLPIASR